MNRDAQMRAVVAAARAAGVTNLTMTVNGKTVEVPLDDKKDNGSPHVYGKEGEMLLWFADELRQKVFTRQDEDRLQRIETALADLQRTIAGVGEVQTKLLKVLEARVVAEYDAEGRVVAAHRELGDS